MVTVVVGNSLLFPFFLPPLSLLFLCGGRENDEWERDKSERFLRPLLLVLLPSMDVVVGSR